LIGRPSTEVTTTPRPIPASVSVVANFSGSPGTTRSGTVT
jgi:hypothetical protein